MKTLLIKSAFPVGLLCSLVMLVSCTTSDRYLNAKTLPPIVVEEGLDKEALGEIFTVPEGDGRIAAGELKQPLPPTLSSNQSLVEPRIQTIDNYSWLVVPKEASATWSQLLLYLRSRQINLVQQDVLNANVQTGWLSLSSASNDAVRYRIHLESAVQPGFTEVHVVNVQGVSNHSSSIKGSWPQVSQNEAHATDLLKDMAKAISNQKATGDSLVASTISFAPKVVSSSVNGEPIVDVMLNAVRAKSSIATSLKENEFEVFEENTTEGVIYFNVGKTSGKDGKKKPFLARLRNFIDRISTAKLTSEGLATNKDASDDLDQILANMPDEAEVNALFPNRAKAEPIKRLSNLSGYFLVQRSIEQDHQRLYIRSPYGERVEPAVAKELLDSIKSQLF